MFLLAASIVACGHLQGWSPSTLAARPMLSIAGPMQAGVLPRREISVWNQIKPAIVTLMGRNGPTGVAALIDDSGYFVAHSSGIAGNQISGVSDSGKTLSFSIVSQDKATMLVLLKTNDWVAGATQPFHAPSGEETESTDLIAVLPTGPLRMAYGTKHKLGVLNPSRRLVPLAEMRFEATPQSVGGALIFSSTGDLIGSLNATLIGPESNQQAVGNSLGPRDRPQTQNSAGGQFGGIRSNQYSNSGPNPMMVAYTVGTDFVRHVLEGFLSPSHTVEFAVLGVMCTDAVGGGALVQSVAAGSPAEKAGIHPGDILLNINSNQIQDQIAFARVMLQQRAGKKIGVMVQRGPSKLILEIVPAKAAD